jgi:septum formation protein
MTVNNAIYLASQSPRRRELLEQIGVSYDVLSVNVEECQQSSEAATDYVQRLSLEKALAGAALVSDRPVLGADTIVVLGDDVLEKPLSEDHAVAMLLRLSGHTHQVMTAVSLVFQAQQRTCINVTSVTFRVISDAEARRYWLSGEPKDKAGAYGIQGLGAVFVEHIEGSYSSVVGLPLFETSALLADFGVSMWSSK